MIHLENIKDFLINIKQNQQGVQTGSLIAIDYGTRKIGIAISDENMIISMPLATIQHPSTLQELSQQIEDLSQGRGVVGFVIGLPKTMSGALHANAAQIMQLSQIIASTTNMPVLLWDESMSTFDARGEIDDFLNTQFAKNKQAKQGKKTKQYKSQNKPPRLLRVKKKVHDEDDSHAAKCLLSRVIDCINDQ